MASEEVVFSRLPEADYDAIAGRPGLVVMEKQNVQMFVKLGKELWIRLMRL